MPLQVLHQVYAACAATAWGLMKFSVPANAIAKWTCSANNRHTKGAKRGREEGEGRDARLKGANVNMNACPAASNISSAIGIQSKLLINMCAAWPRPRPAPAPAPDHGQANAKMTACCCCCCCNSVGVHGSGWRGACLASTVKEQWARGIAWPLDCRQMQCIHGKKFPPPLPPLFRLLFSAVGHLGITGIRISKKKAPSPRVASLPVAAPVNWIRWTIWTFCFAFIALPYTQQPPGYGKRTAVGISGHTKWK